MGHAIVGFPLLLMAFLVFDGSLLLILSWSIWRELSGRGIGCSAAGSSTLLAGFIVLGSPATARRVLGLFLAVDW